MNNKRKILVVDDQLINRQVLKRILHAEYEVVTAGNGAEALKVMEEQRDQLSAVLLDLMMPIMDGYEVLEKAHADSFLSNIPIIVTTQSNGNEEEIKALSMGAYDFLSKPYRPDIIKHRLANIIQLREIAAFINIVEKDPLTGLYNREAFCHYAELLMKQNPEVKYDIICTDIERFKLVNDLYGKEEGDRLLKYIAHFGKGNMPDDSVCGRLRDDIFVGILPCRKEYSVELFHDFWSSLSKYPMTLKISMNHGIYQVDDRNVPIEVMCDRALLANQSIKGRFDTCYAFYDDSIRQKMLHEQMITGCMQTALEEEQFMVYLQPKYELVSENIAGAEALVRWRHPEKGFIMPDEFIPLFEKNGFITKLDTYVWDKTCALISQWLKELGKYVPISVNMSRADIHNPEIPQILQGMLQKYGLEPKHLHLEITETAYTENPQQLIDVVSGLKKLGFIIEMDDFGSGYSSLNMLSQLPIDVLKLDMKFVQNEMNPESGKNILEFILNLARRMSLSVVAEGVEKKEQVELLRDMGCDYVQGYYFAKPMPEADFYELLVDSVVYSKVSTALRHGHEQDEYLSVRSMPEMIRQERNEFLSSRIAGGMMGGYIEEKFPFYFINDRMLEYLGYENEQEFVDDINGYISNCMHPEDAEAVDKAVEEQLLVHEEYTVEYRMRKKDGSYIWVHDIGKRMIAENGKDAITSVCYDITEKKELQEKLEMGKLQSEKFADDTRQKYFMIIAQTGITVWTFDFDKKCIVRELDTGIVEDDQYILENVPESLIEGGSLHPEDITAYRQMYDQMYRGAENATCTVRWKNKNGNGYWWSKITYTTIFDGQGTPQKAIGTCVDVSQQKILEKKLQAEG